MRVYPNPTYPTLALPSLGGLRRVNLPFRWRPRTYAGCTGHLCCKSLDKDDLSDRLCFGLKPWCPTSRCQLSVGQIHLFCPSFPPSLVYKAQREHTLPFHSLKRGMSYYPANVAGYDLDTVSDPATVGSFHSRDPFSAVARLSTEPTQPQPQPQPSTTRAEKPVCAPTNQPTIPFLEVCTIY